MLEIQRVPPGVNSRAPELFDIAALTNMGRLELDRLQRLALESEWQSVAWKAYEAGAHPIIRRGKGEELQPGTKW
jgi:hypothetical protein